MIVYIESNFVLEIALEQEEAPAVENILKLAELGKMELIFPTFALIEPFWTLKYRENERDRLFSSLTQQLNQLQNRLQRSKMHKELAATIRLAPIDMLQVARKETNSLQSTTKRLLSVGKSIEINQVIFEQSLAYQNYYDLSPQDAIIFSAVINHLQQQSPSETKCFISRDRRAFNDPGIKAELKSFNCRYISNFKDGLSFIQSNLM